jgi:serine/threonine-protein phosphatase 5
MKLENYGLALEDGNQAVSLDPNYLKGYYRKGSALLVLNKLEESL